MLTGAEHAWRTSSLSVTEQHAATFDFDLVQLEANRAGLVAAGQLDELWWHVALVLLLALAGGVGVLAAARRWPDSWQRLAIVAGYLIGVVALTVAVAVPAARDLLGPEVAVVEGEVSVTTAGKGEGLAVLVIGPRRILTAASTSQARAAMRSGRTYRVYHLRHSSRLLSLEHLAPRIGRGKAALDR